MKKDYIEKIYAGWLAKIIGIRLGAPIEGWTYERIRNVYGDLQGYPVDYNDFAADDDSNGPLFFLRALEDSKSGFDITAKDVGDALLNYVPFEHGFFWWGGYGVSTEHTAYLNLKNGVEAPESGSIEQNGRAVAEQIGGQIFIDTWGLVTPGDPDLAAKYAHIAASVTHDGNGIYGGIFIASCISYAFVETDIEKIIIKGLSYIPQDCEYSRVVRAVMDFYYNTKGSWRDCFGYIHKNFGYDRYPGNCHIIPNTAVMILALLYGEGDFSNTINICNMCGWDTDCNVGNVATIMGVRCGLSAIDYDKWRAPVNDFLVCSSVVGSLNIMDIPYGALYIVSLAAKVSGEALTKEWTEIIDRRIDSCHFEFDGSTHAIRARAEKPSEIYMRNSSEASFTGKRSLKIHARRLEYGGRMYVYKKTYYKPEDFHDSRYDPCFSPLIYPGQTIHGSILRPEGVGGCTARLYARNIMDGAVIESRSVVLREGEWESFSFTLPEMDSAIIGEIGFAIDNHTQEQLDLFIDDLYFDGDAKYTLNFSKLYVENWTPIHKEISQFTRLKGLFYLEEGSLNLSCSDYAEAYTGSHAWKDYIAVFAIEPITGGEHFVNVRVQGAIRSYCTGFTYEGVVLYKNENGYRKLAVARFDWKKGKTYEISVKAQKNKLEVYVDGDMCISYEDVASPYLSGSVGLSVRGASHCRYHGMGIYPIPTEA